MSRVAFFSTVGLQAGDSLWCIVISLKRNLALPLLKIGSGVLVPVGMNRTLGQVRFDCVFHLRLHCADGWRGHFDRSGFCISMSALDLVMLAESCIRCLLVCDLLSASNVPPCMTVEGSVEGQLHMTSCETFLVQMCCAPDCCMLSVLGVQTGCLYCWLQHCPHRDRSWFYSQVLSYMEVCGSIPSVEDIGSNYKKLKTYILLSRNDT